MTAGIVPAAFFCLGTGAALGVLFLLVKAVGLALRGGRLYTFLSDLAFGIFCGAVVFLCALAVDKGRMRLFQATLQLAGAWAAVTALDPFISGLGIGMRKAAVFLFRLICRPLQAAGQKRAKWKKARSQKKAGRKKRKREDGKRKKCERKAKKRQKTLENFM